MYRKIINPETGRSVNVQGKLGRQVLQKYLSVLEGGTQFLPKSLRSTVLTKYIDKHKKLADVGKEMKRACYLTWILGGDEKDASGGKVGRICCNIYMLMCRIHSVLIIKHKTDTSSSDEKWILVELASKMGTPKILSTDITEIYMDLSGSETEKILTVMKEHKTPIKISEFNTKKCPANSDTKYETDVFSASRGRPCTMDWKIMKTADIGDKSWTLHQVWGLCNHFLNKHKIYSPVTIAYVTANCQAFTAKIWAYITGETTTEPLRKISKLFS